MWKILHIDKEYGATVEAICVCSRSFVRTIPLVEHAKVKCPECNAWTDIDDTGLADVADRSWRPYLRAEHA
jgi:hypothetical protein